MRHDEEIPVVAIERKKQESEPTYQSTCAFRAVTIVVHPRGKGGLTDEEGKLIPLVAELMKRDQVVVGFDPLFIGESFDPSAPFSRRPETGHFETYNPTIANDRMQDLATVVAWSKSRLDGSEVNLIGLDAAAPLVLLARPALDGISRTAVVAQSMRTGGTGADEFRRELDLPGFRQFGGLPGAAALTAPAPLLIFRSSAINATWPTRADASADASRRLRLEGFAPRPKPCALDRR